MILGLGQRFYLRDNFCHSGGCNMRGFNGRGWYSVHLGDDGLVHFDVENYLGNLNSEMEHCAFSLRDLAQQHCFLVAEDPVWYHTMCRV